VLDWAEQEQTLAVCCLSIAELYSGLRHADYGSADDLLLGTEYWDLSIEAARFAGEFRQRYKRQGIQLSTPDALQAALAVVNDATLVTGNVKDFPMPELKLRQLP
jgi:predicted nucleic acid-binding protein